MELSGQQYWSGLPFPTPGDLPKPGIKPESPELAGGFFTTEPPGKPGVRTKRPPISPWALKSPSVVLKSVSSFVGWILSHSLISLHSLVAKLHKDPLGWQPQDLTVNKELGFLPQAAWCPHELE